jgi:hypothetical protein
MVCGTGNKIDLAEQRLVPEAMAIAWCQAHGSVTHYEGTTAYTFFL